MRLKFKNIGELKNVDLKIDGLTVIAGENNTGKSTINKTLYAAFNSLNNLNEHVFKDKINSFLTKLQEELLSNSNGDDFRETFYIRDIFRDNEFNNSIDKIIMSTELDKVKDELENFIKKELNKRDLMLSFDNINKEVFDIAPYLEINDNDIKKKISSKMFGSEFNHQVNNIYNDAPAEVSLEIKDSVITYKIQSNLVTEIKNTISLDLQAVYVDDLYSIDNVKRKSGNKLFEKNHKTALIDSFFNFYDSTITLEILEEKRLNRIYSLVNDVAKGEMVFDGRYGIRYKEYSETDDLNNGFSFSNISAGLKSFIFIKELILNGTLKDNGTIIFDEPEIHLHPEWQIKLAELIVLIQKEYNMHIVLTTHSPYFLYALEVFSTKYGISEKTNYYFSKKTEENISVDNIGKNLEVIYSVLNKPFQLLEDLTNDLY